VDRPGRKRPATGYRKIALIHGDDVVGVFDNVDAAALAGHLRFGWARLIFRAITATDETDYIANVDINHPSFKRIDGQGREGAWQNTPAPSPST
jgi:hypothetical protein